MKSNRAFNAGVLLAIAVVSLFVARAQYYCEQNYMRRKKNEKRVSRYGCRLSNHERRLQELEMLSGYVDKK